MSHDPYDMDHVTQIVGELLECPYSTRWGRIPVFSLSFLSHLHTWYFVLGLVTQLILLDRIYRKP